MDRDEGMILFGIEVCRLNLIRQTRYLRETISELGPFFSFSLFTFALVCGFCGIVGNNEQQNPSNPILAASKSNAWIDSDTGAPLATVVNKWASAALVRPIFQPEGSATQSGTESQGNSAAISPILPTLTGIMISPGGVACTFLYKDGSTVIATVGDYFGAYKVTAIGVDDVKISGPAGSKLLSLNFDTQSYHPPRANSFLVAANDVGLRTWPDRVAGLSQTSGSSPPPR